MDALDVTAIIPTRGDCDLGPILESLIFGDVIVWDNSVRDDFGAFSRYLAIAEAKTDVIYFQDDDCIVWEDDQQRLLDAYEPGILTAMMPPERTDYRDTVLIGWGSIFDRELPAAAFDRWHRGGKRAVGRDFLVVGADFIFPMLSRWKRLDGYHLDLPHAHAENRTWASFPDYARLKETYLNEGREIRDGRS